MASYDIKPTRYDTASSLKKELDVKKYQMDLLKNPVTQEINKLSKLTCNIYDSNGNSGSVILGCTVNKIT